MLNNNVHSIRSTEDSLCALGSEEVNPDLALKGLTVCGGENAACEEGKGWQAGLLAAVRRGSKPSLPVPCPGAWPISTTTLTFHGPTLRNAPILSLRAAASSITRSGLVSSLSLPPETLGYLTSAYSRLAWPS